jgi:hypothetical protein
MTIFQSMCSQKNITRVSVEPISNVECIGTIACTGRTVLVIARIIIAPPAENAALNIDAMRLPAIMMRAVVSNIRPMIRT